MLHLHLGVKKYQALDLNRLRFRLENTISFKMSEAKVNRLLSNQNVYFKTH